MHKKRVSSYGDPMVMVWRSYGFDSTLTEKGLGKGGGLWAESYRAESYWTESYWTDKGWR